MQYTQNAKKVQKKEHFCMIFVKNGEMCRLKSRTQCLHNSGNGVKLGKRNPWIPYPGKDVKQ